jgi:hypothetical protein
MCKFLQGGGMNIRTVGVNDIGRRVGDSHHNAKLTDADVERLLAMHDEGWGYRRLAAKFEVSKSLVRKICKGTVRGQVATDWHRVHVRA